MRLTLTYLRPSALDDSYESGELGPKTVDEWATPNGDECLLVYMLRELEKGGCIGVTLTAEEI